MKSNDKPNRKEEVILLMDDEPQYLSWLIEYLEANGYAVETASNLGEAIQMLELRKYRAILADLSVPIPSEMRSLVEAEGNLIQTFPDYTLLIMLEIRVIGVGKS